jgi:hypothetical protein
MPYVIADTQDYQRPIQDSQDAKFFARDWPAKPAVPVKLVMSNLPPGNRHLSMTRVGHRPNDVSQSVERASAATC